MAFPFASVRFVARSVTSTNCGRNPRIAASLSCADSSTAIRDYRKSKVDFKLLIENVDNEENSI